MKLDRRDFMKIGAAAGAGIGVLAGLRFLGKAPLDPTSWAGKTTGKVEHIPTMCQACTTACGMIAHVKDGKLIGVSGNPEDPNSRGSLCAKGVASPSIQYDPYRVLYPMKRVGKRGEGKWKRISWEEAYGEIAAKLKVIRESGHPEEFFFQQGRNRTTDAIQRFTRAYGTPSTFNHRALCSANRRAAILATLGESDWDLGDYENTSYVLNFGGNWAEAHQGHIPVATRMMKGREKGAKLVCFEARMSNTAALSDEWFPVKPGTDGLIALAMSNVICSEKLWNKEWLDTWSNYPADEYAKHVAQYTPELAEAESGVPASVIRRIAREFAAAAPRCTTFGNRGSHAHWNGFQNDRAIAVLNALVGNVGKPGGYCWHPQASWDKKKLPEPTPVPESPAVKSVIADAKEWPLNNAYPGKAMKVGEIVYLWIKERRQKCSAFMFYNVDPAWSWPESGLVREVLKDEELVPFSFSLDTAYSDTVHLMDIILPWTTYLERWDIDSRPPQGLVDYVGLRQPVVKPLGEAKDVREIFPELARRIGGGLEQFYRWKDTEEYLEEYFKPVPGGFAHMKAHGVYIDATKKPRYEPHLKKLEEADLKDSKTDKTTGIITKGEDPKTKAPLAIGIMVNGVALRGFPTPSRKLEIHSQYSTDKGKAVGRDISPLPIYMPIPSHVGLGDDKLIMISFKWNVHNAHRTMQSKWLREIQNSNPAWLNPATAAKHGVKDGDLIEVTGYRPTGSQVPHDDGSVVGKVKIRVHLTEGVHPMVIAISHNHGREMGGAFSAGGDAIHLEGAVADPDAKRVWWRGMEVAQNNVVPIYPDPATGQQAWHDTVVSIRKV